MRLTKKRRREIEIELRPTPEDDHTQEMFTKCGYELLEEIDFLKKALRAVRVDAIECVLPDKPRQWVITDWAFQKVNEALDPDASKAVTKE